MSDEDSEPEDAQLRALRSVWLSMPDEDPPSAGLAELMAAARAKAEVLAQPPWWRRLFVQMRKPPVLAFATLLVVIGGAIAIGRHGDTVDPSGPLTAPAAPTSGTNEVAPTGDPVRSRAAPSGTISAPGGYDAESQGQGDKAAGGGATQHETETAADGAAKAVAVPTPKHALTSHHSPPPKSPAHQPRPALEVPQDTNRPEAADTAAPDDIDLKKDADTRPVVQGAAAVDSPRKAPTNDDLVSQARAAAARGDCAQANAISARVNGRQSKQRAADPAIAKCATK